MTSEKRRIRGAARGGGGIFFFLGEGGGGGMLLRSISQVAGRRGVWLLRRTGWMLVRARVMEEGGWGSGWVWKSDQLII